MPKTIWNCIIAFFNLLIRKHMRRFWFKTSERAYNLLQFFISYWEKFLRHTKFITQSYLFTAFEFFLTNSNNYFFQIACLQDIQKQGNLKTLKENNWLQLDSNPQSLNSYTKTQPFTQTGLMIELCCEY